MSPSAADLETSFGAALSALARTFDQLAVPYMLVGGIAVGAWTEPRGTKDIDLALALSGDPEPIATALAKQGFSSHRGDWNLAAAEGGNIRLHSPGAAPLVVDLLCAGTPFEREALQHRQQRLILGHPLFVASPDDLLLYKLIAGRPQDLADIDRLLRTGVAPVDPDYVGRWAKEWSVEERWQSAKQTALRL